jgi:inhibitor of cysteine peptidase
VGNQLPSKKKKTLLLHSGKNPSTGYFWYLNVSNGLSILSDYFTQVPAPPEYVGVPGNHIWVIKATSLGTQQVYGSHEQHSRSVPDVIENFTLKIEVV